MIMIGKCAVNANLLSVIQLVKTGFLPLFQIGIPILLIIMGTIDLGKIILTSDEKEMKKHSSRLFKRIGFALACFFMVSLVKIVTNLLVKTNDDRVYSTNDCTWLDYWNVKGD